jgi:predicted CopG family antitoxin
MATKTITIMDDAYDLLHRNKLEDESFSDEIRRVLSNKKARKPIEFFGILGKEGEGMQEDLERIRAMDIKIMKERLK